MALSGINSVDTQDALGRQRQGERGASALEVAIIAGLLDIHATPLDFIAMLAAQAGPYAPKGWTPVISFEADGQRRVAHISDWTGGTGTKPAVGYVKADGTLDALLANGMDFRGATGAQGPAGDTTSPVLYGAGVPSGGLGANGNLYIDVTAGTLYGPKTAGAWGAATNLSAAHLLKAGGTMTGLLTVNAAITLTGLLTGAGAAFSGNVAAAGYMDAATLRQGGANTDTLYEPLGKATINAQVASYTLVLGDAGKLVTVSNAGAVTLTVPPNSTAAFPVGTRVDLVQAGAGQITVTPGSGVTINSLNGYLKAAGQYAGMTLVKVATNTWYLFGALAA